MYKLCFYVPESHINSVKHAIFSTGAGKVGQYDCCAWQTLGEGQFRPLAGSQPHLGQQDQVEKTTEYKVEMVCADDLIGAAIVALKSAHPYEIPAFDVVKLAFPS